MKTLDQLWPEASALGRVEISSDYDGHLYTVEIIGLKRAMFQLENSCFIFPIATGASTDIKAAMQAAINNATGN